MIKTHEHLLTCGVFAGWLWCGVTSVGWGEATDLDGFSRSGQQQQTDIGIVSNWIEGKVGEAIKAKWVIKGPITRRIQLLETYFAWSTQATGYLEDYWLMVGKTLALFQTGKLETRLSVSAPDHQIVRNWSKQPTPALLSPNSMAAIRSLRRRLVPTLK